MSRETSIGNPLPPPNSFITRRTVCWLLVFAAGVIPALMLIFANRNQEPLYSFDSVRYSRVSAVSPEGNEFLASEESPASDPNSLTKDAAKLFAWKLHAGAEKELIFEGIEEITACYSPCGRFIAADQPNAIHLIERTSKKVIGELRVVHDFTRRMAFSYDSRFLAVQDRDVIRVWTLDDQSKVVSVSFDDARLIGFSKVTGELLVINSPEGASDGDASVKTICSLRTLPDLQETAAIPLSSRYDHLHGSAISPSGEHFAIINERGRAAVWNIAHRRKIFDVAAHSDYGKLDGKSVCFSPDGRYLITAGGYGRRRPELTDSPPYVQMASDMCSDIKVWNLQSGRCVQLWRRNDLNYCLHPIPGTANFLSIAVDLINSRKLLHVWRLPD